MKMLREKVYAYIKEKYNAEPEYLWANFPNYSVFRHKDNNKWFGIIMNVPKHKLGLEGDGEIDILDVKCNPLEINLLAGKKGIIPAYHLSRKSWITILLDGSCPLEKVFTFIDQSYQLTSKNFRKKTTRDYNLEWIVPANPKFYDIEKAFNESKEILWKQSSNIIVGDIVYLYLASPYSAIMYKCKAVEVDIPYNYTDKNVSMKRVMKIKLIKKYKKDELPLEILKKHGIYSIRGPIKMLNSLKYRIDNLHKKKT